MNRSVTRLTIVCVITLTLSPAVFALNRRSFVSVNGLDTNVCSPQSPCRGFAAAMIATIDGGDVIALDSGGYGPVTVDKAISIIAPDGVVAAISVFTGNGITVTAVSAQRVYIRGLYISSQGGDNAIAVTTNALVHIDRIVAQGFSVGTASGVYQSSGKMLVTDSQFSGNTYGVYSKPIFISSETTIERSTFQFNSWSVRAENSSTVVVTNCHSTHGYTGYASFGIGSGAPQMAVEGSSASNSGVGFYVEGSNALIAVANSTASSCTIGFVQNPGATFITRGDNTGLNNTVQTSGTITGPFGAV